VEVDPERPVLVDKYLDRADELDVDALCDKDGNVVICGIMQHIEQAGVHSGPPTPTAVQQAAILANFHCVFVWKNMSRMVGACILRKNLECYGTMCGDDDHVQLA
jgi:hypothetical protein